MIDTHSNCPCFSSRLYSYSKVTIKKSTFLARGEEGVQCQVNCNSKDFIKQRRLTQLFLIAISFFLENFQRRGIMKKASFRYINNFSIYIKICNFRRQM